MNKLAFLCVCGWCGWGGDLWPDDGHPRTNKELLLLACLFHQKDQLGSVKEGEEKSGVEGKR
jgi:hypothetical protein